MMNVVSKFISTKRKRAYVCSPLSAPTYEGIKKNMMNVRGFMAEISVRFGCKCYAPHSFLPDFIDDNDPFERKMALEMGLVMLDNCELLFVVGDTISNGMKGEIARAKDNGIPIIYVSRNIEISEVQLPVE